MMDDLTCPVCGKPVRIVTQANLPHGFVQRRWWAQCGKCAYMSKTFDNAQQVRVHLGQERD